jgi:hypothetical protein
MASLKVNFAGGISPKGGYDDHQLDVVEVSDCFKLGLVSPYQACLRNH